MKKTAILFLSFFSAAAYAQSVPMHEPVKEADDEFTSKIVKVKAQAESGSTVIWSEDFANGVPSSWSNFGTPTAAQWEYRGPNTTPDNSQGSRGAYGGATPIASPTLSNGFMIFDSDYLDNNGVAGAFGTGIAPTPHVGKLETGVIDLSMHQDVLIKFASNARKFQARFLLAFSTDGGTTFGDTIEVHPGVGVNSATLNAQIEEFNVSSAIGGQSNVVVQFIFDGSTNGDGYYYWMIDDVSIETVPRNSLRFTMYEGAPEQDIIYRDTTTDEGPYGILQKDQIVPMYFDANAYNFGTQTQTNVRLEVEVMNGSNLVTTLTSSACPNLAPGDTCNYNTLKTPWWTPDTIQASYDLVFKVTSDTLTASTTTAIDTIPQFVNNSLYGMDRSILSNVTSPSLLAVAARYPMLGATDGNSSVLISGVQTYISTTTDSTADMEIAIYDTAGFPTNSPTLLASQVFSLTGADLGTTRTFDMTTNGQPISLPTGTYFVQASFFPNATDGVVRVGNDGSFEAGGTSLMLFNDGNWYGGFSNSNSFEAVWLRPILVSNVSVTENDLNSFSVYPNPVRGLGYVEFEMGGSYEINLYDMVGNAVRSINADVNANERIKVDYDNLPAGVYLLNVAGEGLNKTVKLTVQ